MKKSTPARAKKIDAEVPLSASSMALGGQTSKASEAQAVLKTVGNQKDRGKLALAELQAEIKHHGSVPNAAAQRALNNIKARYGDDAFHEAIRKFNMTFQGIQPPQYPRNRGSGNGHPGGNPVQ